MKIKTPSEKFVITYTAQDGDNDLFVRCKIFDNDLNDVTLSLTGNAYINLPMIIDGFYGGASLTGIPVGEYVILFKIYSDSGYTNYHYKYGFSEEDYRVIDIKQVLLDKLNEVENNLTETVDYGDGVAV